MLTRKWYSVVKSKFSEDEIEKVKKILTVKPYIPKGFGPPPKSFPIFKESEEKLFVPRNFGIDYFGPPKKNTIKNGISIDVEFNGSLREQQKPIVKKVYKEMKKQGHCILHAVTGMGKTSMSLYLTSKLKQKTLILVHQDFLLNQWVERIEQFLPNAKIGILKQSRIEVEDKDIVIGMIQSICSRKYDIFKQFGFVVCDEYHHFGAEYFSQVLYSCGARYMLGLTATPQRKDGLTKVLKWHLGEILSFTKTDILYNVSIECLRFRPKHDEFKIKKSYYGGVNVANLINQVCTHKGRNEMIRKELIKYGRIGRQILVLSDRVQHLKDLKDSIPEDISTGLYIGGMTQEERKISETKTIIFGTFVLIKEAVDIPSLNTLVLATSKSDIIQAVGRILRKKHPKFDPLIIDIIDELSLFERQAEKRRKYYEKQGYTILDPMKPVIVEDVENSNICLFDD
jgi:superfamily II DNA or RNA helicase